jgi:hypothetical protein
MRVSAHAAISAAVRADAVPAPAQNAPAQTLPPHALLQTGSVNDIVHRPTSKPKSDVEEADRIAGALLQGSGPILLCMPGTGGKPYEGVIASTARALIKLHGGAVSIASIPYGNGAGEIPIRFLSRKKKTILALVIERLKQYAPNRPILLVGESQGSWAAASDLQDPAIAGAVTRGVLFSKPGFQTLPTSVGQATAGAAAVGLRGGPGLIEIRHSDDIVPSLFNRLNGSVVGGFLNQVVGGLLRGNPQYPPHKYAVHGDDAAKYLLFGEQPTGKVHPSKLDESMPAA